MKWVTWENIGVDRMACIWLIRGWIDPKAAFLFISVETKPLPKDAEPFDIQGRAFLIIVSIAPSIPCSGNIS